MTFSRIMTSLIASALLLSLLIRSAPAGEAPKFDPNRDSIDTILATLPWIPPGTLKPPTIDRSVFKPSDVPIDPAWTRVETVWRPGVPKLTGHTISALVKESGGLTRTTTKRVGHCTDYDQNGRVLADGSWDAEGKPIGCHLAYADLSVAAALRLKPSDPLPLLAVTIYPSAGASTVQSTPSDLGDTAAPTFWDPTNRPISEGKITFFPAGELESISWTLPVSDPSPTRIPGVTTVRFHPPAPGRVAANDPAVLMGIRTATPVSVPQVAKFIVRPPGEGQTERVVTYNSRGRFAEISSGVIGTTRSNDPRNWKLAWDGDGVFTSLKVGDALYAASSRWESSAADSTRRVIRWNDPTKLEAGISAMGFAQQMDGATWVAAGPWTHWNAEKALVFSGAFANGKPIGAWTECRYEVGDGHRLIEKATGAYQDGFRHGLWRIECRAGHPDVPVGRDAIVKMVTYLRGEATSQQVTIP